MIITLRQLKKLKACQAQIDLFHDTFGKSVDLSKLSTEDIDKYSHFFSVTWLASKILKGQVLTEYKKIIGQAWAEYKKIEDQALAKYYKIKNRAGNEFKKIPYRAWAEYNNICGQALAEYQKIKGQAFVKICLT